MRALEDCPQFQRDPFLSLTCGQSRYCQRIGKNMVAAIPEVRAPVEEHVPPDTLVKLRQDFAEKCFSNAQDLSRMMDQKAGYLLSAVGLLTTALGIVAAKAMDVAPSGPAQAGFKIAGTAFFLAYVIVAFLVVYNSTRVFQAMANRVQRGSTAPGLMFPLVLLDRYRADEKADEEIYFRTLSEVGTRDMLRDLATEIVDISFIYRAKQQRINAAANQFRWLSMFWIVTLLLYLGTVILR
jgi:hypothetical protein